MTYKNPSTKINKWVLIFSRCKNLLLTIILFYFIFNLLGQTSAHADAVANVNHNGSIFTSAGGEATAEVSMSDASLGTLEIRVGRKRRKISLSKNILMKFDFILSDDGTIIVAYLKSAFLGRIHSIDQGQNFDALIFIHDDQILRTYKYTELMKDPTKAWLSVSHTHWLFEGLGVEFQKDTLTLMTLDGNKYVFQLSTGQIKATSHFNPDEEKKKNDLKAWKKTQPSPLSTRYPTWLFSGLRIQGIAGEKLHFEKGPDASVLLSLLIDSIPNQGFFKSIKSVSVVIAIETGKDLAGGHPRSFIHYSDTPNWIEVVDPTLKLSLDLEQSTFSLNLPFKNHELSSFPNHIIQLENNPLSLFQEKLESLQSVFGTLQVLDSIELYKE